MSKSYVFGPQTGELHKRIFLKYGVCVCARNIFSLLTNIEPHKNIFPISAEISFLL